MSKSIVAYKVFNPNWKCRDYQFEVGKSYKHTGEVKLCNGGFHACVKLIDCFNYYDFNPDNKIAEVLLSGKIDHGNDNGDKVCAEKIKVVREISWNEALTMINIGKANTGKGNTGHQNTGHWNTGDRNTGHFNTVTPDTILVFNKPCKRDRWDEAYKPSFLYFSLTQWVYESEMTDQEKKDNPTFFTTGGYLKKFTYQEAFKRSYDQASQSDKDALKKLPNFNKKVFFEISGIEV